MEKISKPPVRTEMYFQRYLDTVPEDGLLIRNLSDQLGETVDLFASLPPEKQAYAYAPGKWTLKEVLQHIIDTERVFAYRALRIARADRTPLPGFDQDVFAAGVDANARPMEDLLEEYRLVRLSSLALVKSFTPEAIDRRGEASGNELDTRTIVNLMYGHNQHHLLVIREKYL